jgi:hypothetical protein
MDTSWRYGRMGVENDTQILIPEKAIVNSRPLQILVDWNSLA